MENYKILQFEIEYDYVMDNFFNNYQLVSPFTKVKGEEVYKCNVLVNDMLYDFYKYEMGKIILLPKDKKLFHGDFNDIYQFDYNNNGGISLTITRKHDNVIENINYDFNLNNSGYNKDHLSALLKYKIIEDNDNLLCKIFNKENTTSELFINKNFINLLKLPKNEMFAEIRKYGNKTIERCVYRSIDEMNQCYANNDLQFEKLDITDNVSLICLLQDVVNSIKKTKKR